MIIANFKPFVGEIKAKKCPVCNSKKIKITKDTIHCEKCGYTHK